MKELNMKLDLASFSVLSCGHTFMTTGMGADRLSHNYIFTYVTKGYDDVWLHNKMCRMDEGSFIVQAPGYMKTSYMGDGVAENYYLVMEFTDRDVPPVLPMEYDRIYKVKHTEDIERKLRELVEESMMQDSLHEMRHKMLFAELVIYLMRRTKDIKLPDIPAHHIGAGFVSYLLYHYSDRDYSLGEIADMCRMSKSHLSHKFKSETGLSPIEYRNLCRLKKAILYLCESDMSMEMIAERVGFNSVTYFCEIFKKNYNISPYQYRKNNKDK